MEITKEEFQSLMRLYLKDYLTREAIVIPLQCYIQRHGFLNENDPLEAEFIKKFKGNENEKT